MSKAHSKNKGNSYERKICQELREMGYTAQRSSYVNKRLDDDGKVDIETNFPFNIQCKRTEQQPNFVEVLESMDDTKRRVVYWKKNHAPELVVMLKEDFIELHDTIKALEEDLLEKL